MNKGGDIIEFEELLYDHHMIIFHNYSVHLLLK